jgi:hypothetical protein
MPLEVALAVRPRNHIFKCSTMALVFLVVTLGCSHQPNGTPRNAAAEAALNVWWEGTFSDGVQPEKPGTVTPAHSITIKGGRVLRIGKHIQTKEEHDEQQKDLLWEQHRRSVVKGFRVEQDTVIVLTNLTENSTYDGNPIDKRDAQEVCHELGNFVWGKADRRWGLKNIRVFGGNGELLSLRNGLGNVQ